MRRRTELGKYIIKVFLERAEFAHMQLNAMLCNHEAGTHRKVMRSAGAQDPTSASQKERASSWLFQC